MDDCELLLSAATEDVVERAAHAITLEAEAYVACNRHPPVHRVTCSIDVVEMVMTISIDGDMSVSHLSDNPARWDLAYHCANIACEVGTSIRAVCVRAAFERGRRMYKCARRHRSDRAHKNDDSSSSRRRAVNALQHGT